MASSTDTDGGFITPVLGGLAIALTLVAVASTQAVRTDTLAARRDWERLADRQAAEGVAAIAAWRILQEPGTPSLAWAEPSSRGPLQVRAEPEARKLGLGEVAGPRGQARLDRLLGREEAAAVSEQLATLAERRTGPPPQDTIRALSRASIWRACGLTLVSGFSRLTDNALEPPRPPAASKFQPRAGEAWRIQVSARQQVIVDRIVRMTGDPGAPVLVVDESAGQARTARDCQATINVDKDAAG